MSTAATAAAELLQQHQQQFQHRAASLAAAAAELQDLQRSQQQLQLQHTGQDGMGRFPTTILQAPQTVQPSSRPGQVCSGLPHQTPSDKFHPSQTAALLLTKHHPSTVQASVPKGSSAGLQPAAEGRPGSQPRSMQLDFSTPASEAGPGAREASFLWQAGQHAPKPAVLRPAPAPLPAAQQQQHQKQQQAQQLAEPTLINTGRQQQGQQGGEQPKQDLLQYLIDYESSDDEMCELEAPQQLPKSRTGPSAAAGSVLAHAGNTAAQAQQASPLPPTSPGRTTQQQDPQRLQPTAQREALGPSPKRRRLVGPPSAGGASPAVGCDGQGPGSFTGMQGPSSSLGLPQLQVNQPSEVQAAIAAMQAAMSAATAKATTAVLECLAEEAAQAALACRAGRSSHQVTQQPVTVTVASAARVRLLASLASPAVDAVASLTPASAGELRNLPVCGRGQTAASVPGLPAAERGMSSYDDLAGIAAAVEPAWARVQLLAAAQAAVSQPQYGLRGWFWSAQHLLQQLLATDLQLEVDDSNKWSAGPWLQHVVSAIVHLAEALHTTLQVLQPSPAQPNTSASAAATNTGAAAAAAVASVTAAATAAAAAAAAAAGSAAPSHTAHTHTLSLSSTGTAAGAPVPFQAALSPPAAAVKQQGTLLPSVPKAFAAQAPAAASSAAATGSLHADNPGAGHSSLQPALGFNPDGVLVSAEGIAAAEAALSSAVQRAAAELTAARAEAGATAAAGGQPAGNALHQAVPQGLGAKGGAAHAGLRVSGSILLPLVRLMVPGLPKLLSLSRGTAGPISNAAVRVDQGQAAHSKTLTGQVSEEQLLTLSGLQAACLYVALPELQQQLLRFAIGAAGADGLPGNGLAGWIWNAHWELQQQLEGHTRLPAVGSLQQQLQAAVGSIVNLSRLLLLALSMLQRGRAVGAVMCMMLPASAAVTATAAPAPAAVAKAATVAAVAAAAPAPAGATAGATKAAKVGAAAVAKAPAAAAPAAAAVAKTASAAATAATVKAAAAPQGHQQLRPQAALVHHLSPIQVLQLPLPDDADNQIMADIAAAVAAAQQTAQASYNPQKPCCNRSAGRYASWPEFTDSATVRGLFVGVMPQAAALEALTPQDLVHLTTCPISSTEAVKRGASTSIAHVVLTERSGLQAALYLIGGHRPLKNQLTQALTAASLTAGDGLRGFFRAALAVYKEEWPVGAVLRPQQRQDTAECVQSTVLSKVRFAHLLVRILHLLLPQEEEQRLPAAAAAAVAAAAAAEQGGVQGHLLQQPQVKVEEEGLVQQQQQHAGAGAVGPSAGPPKDMRVKVKLEPS